MAAVAGLAYGWDAGSLSLSPHSTSSPTTLTDRRKAYGSLTYTAALR